MSHQLSLDISLFLLHSLVFLFPSFHWVMSWSNTNEVRESSLSCSQYTWSSSGRRHINSTHSVIAINCNICSRCWWSTFNVGQKNRDWRIPLPLLLWGFSTKTDAGTIITASKEPALTQMKGPSFSAQPTGSLNTQSVQLANIWLAESPHTRART